MLTNLPPEYFEADKRFREAQTRKKHGAHLPAFQLEKEGAGQMVPRDYQLQEGDIVELRS
jgi:hypothetical protein